MYIMTSSVDFKYVKPNPFIPFVRRVGLASSCRYSSLHISGDLS